MINLGFSTGVLYKSSLTMQKRIAVINEVASAIELGFIKVYELEKEFQQITAKDLEGFVYVSLHAPKPASHYGFNEETRKILEQITHIHHIRNLDLVVFHPDNIKDFDILKCVEFPVAIENMDYNKLNFQKPLEFKELLNKYPKIRLVLDVNHIYTIDPTMLLACNFYDAYRNEITQIHLSGFSSESYHDLLYRTKQTKIIYSIQDRAVQIIIESAIESNASEKIIKGKLIKEKNYILDTLS